MKIEPATRAASVFFQATTLTNTTAHTACTATSKKRIHPQPAIDKKFPIAQSAGKQSQPRQSHA